MKWLNIIATGLALATVIVGVGACNMLINFGLAARTFAERSNTQTNAVIVDLPGLTRKK